MRIVLDARTVTDHFPGIGRYVVSLGRAMAGLLQEGEQLALLRDPTRPCRWDLETVEKEGGEVVDVSLSPFSLRQQWMIPPLLADLGADVYHSPYYLMPFRAGIPTLLTVYDLIPLLFPRQASLRARLLFRWATALALKTASHVIAISQATRRDVLKAYRVSPDKLSVVPLAADPAFHPSHAFEIEGVRHRYGLPDRYALYLGSNKPHKNLVRLVEAWAGANVSSASLVIAGAWDPHYAQPRERTLELGVENTIHFLGPIPEQDLCALYGGAMFAVFPTLYEGFGLPVLEAMACGTPVICSNASSLPEVAGDAALYFDPTDTESIAQAIRCAMDDPGLRTMLLERGIARAAQFSWERAARKTLDLYRQVWTSATGSAPA
jgi:glycosyltransferase involved in cell wall biosynthesis